MASEPFTPVYQAIWSALAANSDFASLVKIGNQQDLTLTRLAQLGFKKVLNAGDTPEVILLQGSFHLKPFGFNSRAAYMSQVYPLITTFENLALLPMNQLKYSVLVALTALGADLGLGNLIYQWTIDGGEDDAIGHAQWKRSSNRFVSLMNIQVEMCRDRNAL